MRLPRMRPVSRYFRCHGTGPGRRQMTYTNPTKLDHLALTIPCTRCNAPARQWCTFRHGWARELHKARREPTEAIYWHGVTDGRRQEIEAFRRNARRIA